MLGKLSPSLTQGDSNKLVQAASNQHPNTLEFLLDAVRRQISGKDVTPTPISNRDSLYANLKVLTDSPTFVTLAGNVTLSLADRADSMGCRNISTMEVLYGKTKGVDARENRSVSDAFARAP